MSEECLCERCTALCCHYFALEIDEPESPAEFDDVRWYLMHEAVHVFVEDGNWHLSIQNKCQHLRGDNRCGVYEDRPKICREFSTDNCDFHLGNYGFELYFTEPEQLEAYAQEKLGDKYRKYAARQRVLNTGGDAKQLKPSHPDHPDRDAVLEARRRPRIKGYLTKGGRRPASAAEALVQLSVASKRNGE